MLSVNNVGWMEKEKPVAGPLDAILRPVAVAPCSSDTHTSHGGSGDQKNLILGHEAIGEVVEVGELVTRFKPGDIVVVPCCTPDWLEPNSQGKYNAHDHGLMASFKFLLSKDGVFAEYFHVNQADANLVKLPEGMDMAAALMTVDMMSTGFFGVEQAGVEFGDTVVVIGIGPVGLMAVAGAHLKGAGRLIAVGTRPNGIAVAKEYGATDIVSYKEGDIVEQIMKMTDGKGVDRVIIAGGKADTINQALNMLKPGGVVSNMNYFDASETFEIPAWEWGLGMSNKDIRGGFCPGGALRIEKMLEMIQYNRFDPAKLITHRFEGFDKIEDAFLLMDEKPADLIKPAVFIKWD
ncbi:NADP-dependent isopropanol dehydrogenase [Methanimicrococcus hongohii]|uniref:NADP-dependent isopropanol dehydrogenase n=1 Tax=Methanimicrococcus hongohii TaxID=3028295 RepID=A0AA96V2C5_9EURY|nr:NAD(P)-dependent alcohol dehydrogenase [Methanimicrococcus sp. Hf6]WNY23808.1 NADP-dependent isopropanol dehydrogenase [Methanimicrococcus sp. Hf6]